MCPIIVTPGGGSSGGGGSRPIRDFFKLSAALAHNIIGGGNYTVPAGYSLFAVGANLGATNTTGQIVATLNAVPRQIFQLAEGGGVAAAGSVLFACNTPFPDVAANLLGTESAPEAMPSSITSGQDLKKIDSEYIHRLDAGTVISVTGTLTAATIYGFLVADADLVGGSGSSSAAAGVHFDNVQDITTSGNFVAPKDGTYYVTMIGGGGGAGGGSSSNGLNSRGSGGGAGETVWRFPVRLLANEVVPATIGTAGAGQPGAYAAGSDGGNTSFGNYATARAGAGGSNTPGISLGGGGGRSTEIDVKAFDASKCYVWPGANNGRAGFLVPEATGDTGNSTISVLGGSGLGISPNGGAGGNAGPASGSAPAANSGAGGGAATNAVTGGGANGGTGFIRVEW